MKITIIGHGDVGQALATRWTPVGHQITFGVRNLEDEKVKVLQAQEPSWQIKSISDSAANPESVLVIAIPAPVVPNLAESLGSLRGRIVIDTTNSVFRKPDLYENGFDALRVITGAEVAKCFNSTGVENMRHPIYTLNNPSPHEIPLDMPVAGSSEEAKKVAMQLATDAGFRAYDFGDDSTVPMLEELCRIWINLSRHPELGRDFGLKIIKRDPNFL